MSVINKMLRDLDQRQAKTLTETFSEAQSVWHGATPNAASDIAANRRPVQTHWRQRQAWAWMGGFLVLAAVATATWFWQSRDAVPVVLAVTPTYQVVAESVASLPQATLPKVEPHLPQSVASAPVAPQPIIPSSAVSAAVAAVVNIVPKSVPAPVALAVSAVATPPTSAPNAAEVPVTLGLRLDTSLRAARPVGSPAAPERLVSSRPDAPVPNAGEALERAQTLWSAGSRDTAREFMQDAVAVAERQGVGGNFPQGNPALLPLVRELTRMQLADARHGAVLDLLTRLEPQLGNVPDLWAIRGNAAQRLGRHQDSVHAYMVALQSRPNEQRWLLGAAVSLAALGQFSSAAEMADKARALGVIGPEVLAYLRQQGVPLKDQ